MKRRTFLRAAAGGAALGGTGALAGCLDGGSKAQDSPTDVYDYDTASATPVSPIVSRSFDWETPGPETLVVSLEVHNQTTDRHGATVTATVSYPDAEPQTREKSVELGGGGVETLEFTFDRPADGGQPSIEFDIQAN